MRTSKTGKMNYWIKWIKSCDVFATLEAIRQRIQQLDFTPAQLEKLLTVINEQENKLKR